EELVHGPGRHVLHELPDGAVVGDCVVDDDGATVYDPTRGTTLTQRLAARVRCGVRIKTVRNVHRLGTDGAVQLGVESQPHHARAPVADRLVEPITAVDQRTFSDHGGPLSCDVQR